MLLKRNQGKIRVVIKDQGEGISQDLIYQLTRSPKLDSNTGLRGEKGTGFGLIIVVSILNRIGAEYVIRSRLKK